MFLKCFLYDFLIILFMPFFVIRYLFRGRALATLARRFYLNESEKFKISSLEKTVWIQAVSVGEVTQISHLVSTLAEDHVDMVISVINPKAYELALKKYSQSAVVIYFPVDLSFIIKSYIKLIKPALYISIETELWPNLILLLKSKNVPVMIINGRISDKSFPSYMKNAWFFRKVFASVDCVYAQNENYAKRFIACGTPKEKVTSGLNLKYLAIGTTVGSEAEKFIKEWNFFRKERFVLVCGSTHNPEEDCIADVILKLKSQKIPIRTVIVPRHIERGEKILETLTSKKVKAVLFTQSKEVAFTNLEKDVDVLIVDAIGMLGNFYALADAVFVGGSLIPHGGQNFLEPAQYSVPIICGEHMHNFQEMFDEFKIQNALTIVKNSTEFATVLSDIFKREGQLLYSGKKAHDILRNNAENAKTEFLKVKQRIINEIT